jgi:hypothetical protein
MARPVVAQGVVLPLAIFSPNKPAILKFATALEFQPTTDVTGPRWGGPNVSSLWANRRRNDSVMARCRPRDSAQGRLRTAYRADSERSHEWARGPGTGLPAFDHLCASESTR